MLNQKNWFGLQKFLSKETYDPRIKKLSDTKAKIVVQDVIVRALVDQCRADVSATTSSSMIACVVGLQEAAQGMPMKLDPLSDELDKLQSAIGLADHMSDDRRVVADRAREQLLNNKQGLFWKALTMLPCGKEAMKLAAACSDSMVKMKALKRELDQLCANTPCMPEAANLWKAPPNLGFDCAPWVDYNMKLCNILANGTGKFQTDHKVELQGVQENQVKFVAVLANAFIDICRRLFAKYAEEIVQVIDTVKVNGISPEDGETALCHASKILDIDPMVKDIPLDKFANKKPSLMASQTRNKESITACACCMMAGR